MKFLHEQLHSGTCTHILLIAVVPKDDTQQLDSSPALPPPDDPSLARPPACLPALLLPIFVHTQRGRSASCSTTVIKVHQWEAPA